MRFRCKLFFYGKLAGVYFVYRLGNGLLIKDYSLFLCGGGYLASSSCNEIYTLLAGACLAYKLGNRGIKHHGQSTSLK